MTKRSVIALSAVCAAAVVSLAIVISYIVTITPKQPPSSTSPTVVTLTGTLVCLPHKGDGPHTLECTVGLKGDDGRYYALREMPKEAQSEGVQTKMSITGQLTPPKADESYDIAGEVKVETYTKEP